MMETDVTVELTFLEIDVILESLYNTTFTDQEMIDCKEQLVVKFKEFDQ